MDFSSAIILLFHHFYYKLWLIIDNINKNIKIFMNEINKKTILLFVFAIIFIIDTYCMIEPFTFSRPIIKTKYQPIIQQNPLLEEIRLMLAGLSENETLFKKHSGPEIEKLRQVDASLRASLVSEKCLYSIRNQTVEEAQYECMQYMLAKTIGFKSNHIKIMLENYASTCIDEFKYFKQTDRPKRNDIVIYSTTRNLKSPSHYGIFLDHDKVESKWGNSSDIVVHKLFHTPPYGDYATFWTLKNKFRKLPQALLINL